LIFFATENTARHSRNQNPSAPLTFILSPPKGEGVKKLKKVGEEVKKILDYTYDYMLSFFYIP